MYNMKSANINVRLDEGLYRKLREENVNISEVVRVALIAEMERKRIVKIQEAITRSKAAVKRIGLGRIVADIREARESR